MSKIVIAIDDIPITVQPDNIVWTRRVVAKDGSMAPIYGPYYSVGLSNGLLTGVVHDVIFALMDSQTHTIRLPHPDTGVMTDFTGYVDMVAGRYVLKSGKLAMSGLDIQISKVVV